MKQAIARLVVLIVLLINQTLILFGWTPLPYDEEQIYEAVSTVLTIGMSIYVWWENNNVTKEAQEADEWLKELKRNKKNMK